METTVSMSLERFKELESKEIVLEKINNDPNIVFACYSWNASWRCLSKDEALEDMRKEVEEIKRFAEHWRLKAKECK